MPTLNRRELLEKLQTVAPALADNELVPVLTHFLFTGKQVVAYNDRIGISAPLVTEFKGAVPGKLLLDLVSMATYTKNIGLDQTNAGVRVTAGKARINLAVLPTETFSNIFEMPPKPKDGISVDKEKFIAAIDDCLLSVHTNATQPDQLGITLIPNGSALNLYATNAKTISHAKLKLQAPKFKDRVILSVEFCKQVLRHKGSDWKLVIQDDSAVFAAGEVMIFGRLIDTEHPLNFEAAIKRHLPPNYPRGMVDISEKKTRARLKIAFDMATRVTNVKGNEAPTEIEVRNGQIELKSASNVGEILDRVPLAHPEVAMRLNTSLVSSVYDRYDHILITRECALMTRGDSMYMVASSSHSD